MTSIAPSTASLTAYIQELETYLPQHQRINEKVSTGSVGWHIEHILLVLDVIIHALQQSQPKDYQWRFNWRRTMIATINRIPRGKVKAPKVVQPEPHFTGDSLKQHLAETRERLKGLQALESNHHFVHPFLGIMNAKPAIKFLGLHTRHHLEIIRNILSSN
jgi:hypothetical protein